MSAADVVRWLTVLVLATDCALLPLAVGTFHRPGRVWLLFAYVVGLSFFAIISVHPARHEGRLVWYHTPLLLVVGALGLVYVLVSLSDHYRR